MDDPQKLIECQESPEDGPTESPNQLESIDEINLKLFEHWKNLCKENYKEIERLKKEIYSADSALEDKHHQILIWTEGQRISMEKYELSLENLRQATEKVTCLTSEVERYNINVTDNTEQLNDTLQKLKAEEKDLKMKLGKLVRESEKESTITETDSITSPALESDRSYYECKDAILTYSTSEENHRYRCGNDCEMEMKHLRSVSDSDEEKEDRALESSYESLVDELCVLSNFRGTIEKSGSGTFRGITETSGSGTFLGFTEDSGSDTFRGITEKSGTGTFRGITEESGSGTFRGITEKSGPGTFRGITAESGSDTFRGITAESGSDTFRGITAESGPGTFRGITAESGSDTFRGITEKSGTGTFRGITEESGSDTFRGITAESGSDTFRGITEESGSGTFRGITEENGSGTFHGITAESGSDTFRGFTEKSGVGTFRVYTEEEAEVFDVDLLMTHVDHSGDGLSLNASRCSIDCMTKSDDECHTEEPDTATSVPMECLGDGKFVYLELNSDCSNETKNLSGQILDSSDSLCQTQRLDQTGGRLGEVPPVLANRKKLDIDSEYTGVKSKPSVSPLKRRQMSPLRCTPEKSQTREDNCKKSGKRREHEGKQSPHFLTIQMHKKDKALYQIPKLSSYKESTGDSNPSRKLEEKKTGDRIAPKSRVGILPPIGKKLTVRSETKCNVSEFNAKIFFSSSTEESKENRGITEGKKSSENKGTVHIDNDIQYVVSQSISDGKQDLQPDLRKAMLECVDLHDENEDVEVEMDIGKINPFYVEPVVKDSRAQQSRLSCSDLDNSSGGGERIGAVLNTDKSRRENSKKTQDSRGQEQTDDEK